jgi:hypothetical protein
MQSVKLSDSDLRQEVSRESSTRADQNHRSKGGGRSALRSRINRAGIGFRCVWSIWCSAFRSLRGHIQIQPATRLPNADFGPALRQLPNGSLEPNRRTLSRSHYTQILEATHSWVDCVDIQIFLMGFDAGEQWVLRNGSETGKDAESAWLVLAEERFKYLGLS